MLMRMLLLLAALLSMLSAQTTVQLSSTSFTFEGIAGAEPPPSQSLSIVTTDGSPIQFSVRPDSDIYHWLGIQPINMTTPGRVRIAVNPANLQAGTHTARLLVTDAQGRSLVASPLTVTFNVTSGTPQLQVSPQFIRLSGSVSGSALSATILIRIPRPGNVTPVAASVVSPTPWLRVSAANCTPECAVPVAAALTGLAPGAHQGTVQISTAFGSIDVPVSLFLSNRSPLISLLPDGLYFEAEQGSRLAQTRTVSVINPAEGALSWGVNLPLVRWLALATTAAPVTPGSPGTLTVIANPNGLAQGVYSTTIDITSAAGNLTLPVRLRVTPGSTNPALSLQPAGILFKAAAGAEAQVRSARIISPTSGPIAFQASAQINETQGTGWLSVTPSRGAIPGHEGTGPHAGVNIAAAPLNLRPGFYTGEVVFSPGSPVTTSMNVGLVVTPAAESCNPNRLALVHTGLPDNFQYRIGTPVPVSVQMMDDCGNTPDATITVLFSTGEALALEHQGGGTYGTTWVPRIAGQSISATARAFSGSLPSASAAVTGTVIADSLPTIFQGGVLDNLNAIPGAALAPGAIVQIFGAAFAPATAQASFTGGRLPLSLGGAAVTIGGIEAPLYFVSPGQINAQVPFELTAGRRHSVTVTSGGITTNAETITVSPAQPGIAALPDGRAIAQNANFGLIGTAQPARPGDYVVIYLTGMGATTPPVASGAQSPADPLSRAARDPRVLLDGKPVEVLFAGLTPGLAGLFQINFRVPADQRPGDLKLTVSQDGAHSNEVTLPVR